MQHQITDIGSGIGGSSSLDEEMKAYLDQKKRREDLRRLIIDCSSHQIRSKQLTKDFDEEFNTFGKYLTKFHSYITFKQKHPYADTHPDFEHEVTPVTILDSETKQMKYYLPD